MENKVVNLEIKSNVDESIAGLKELKRQLKETAAGSEEFKKLYNQIDDLQDKINSAKNTSADWVDSLEQAGGPLGMLGAGLNRAKVATQTFGGALKATGIGLIVSLLGGLVAAFSENEGAMKKIQPLLDGLKKIFQGVFRAVEPLFDTFIDLATQALPYVTKGIGMVYSAMMAYFTFIKESGGGVMKILKGIFTLDADAISAGVDQIGGSFKKTQTAYTDSMQRFSEGSKELTKREKEELEKREEDRKKALEKKEEAEKKAAERAEELRKKELEKRKKYNEDVLKGQEELKKATEEANKKYADEEAKIQADAQKVLDDLAQSKETPAQKLQREFEEKKAILELANQSTFELEMQHLSDMDNLDADQKAKQLQKEKALTKSKIDLAKAEKDAKLAQAGAIANSLDGLAKIAGEKTAVGKALAIASATINTYKGISEVWGAASMGNPVVDMAVKIASTAIVAAQGIANVQKIMSVQVPEGGGGGGGSAPSAPVAQAPNFNVVGASSTSQLAQTIGTQQNTPVKAYVVSNDVTTAQALDRNIVQSASL